MGILKNFHPDTIHFTGKYGGQENELKEFVIVSIEK